MRDLTPELLEAASQQMGSYRFHLLAADFGPPGWLRLWDGPGVKAWNGKKFYSGLNLINVEVGGAPSDGTAENLEFKLSWQDENTGRTFIDDALSSTSGGVAWCKRGFINDAGAIIRDPYFLWRGRVSTPIVDEGQRQEDGGPGPLTVTVRAEHQLTDRDRSQKFRITPASQLYFARGDKGLIYLPTLSTVKLKWGDLFYAQVKGQ